MRRRTVEEMLMRDNRRPNPLADKVGTVLAIVVCACVTVMIVALTINVARSLL